MNIKNISLSKASYILNLFGVGGFLVVILWLMASLIKDGLFPLASILGAIVIFVLLVYLRPHFTPIRWLGIAFVFVVLFTVYPIIYTFYLSVTNMGAGHLMSKTQAIERLEAQRYLPEEGTTYSWTAYQSPEGDYALWLMSEEGAGLLVKPGVAPQSVSPGEAGVGELDENGIPIQIAGYQRLEHKSLLAILDKLGAVDFGQPPDAIRIRSMNEAAVLVSLYVYDPARDVIVNQETGEIYEPVEGTFTSPSGEKLTPGYITIVGQRQFVSFLGNKGFREPLVKMFGWNVMFALLTVFVSFAVGLVVTLLFDDLPGRQIIRAILIVPWPIPVLVSVLIWRSMLHPDVGFVAPILESLFGSSPQWFQNAFWTRFALVMVNVWLSYPYFYVITAGALRSIPEEIYDAATVDGAGFWNRFYYVTSPLLLRILTPLLIASFTFNFNNFNVIFIFNFGQPAMAGTIVPMGQTDILISFVYRLAFLTSNTTNYGLAAAITTLLFVFVSVMVLLQVRVTSVFKET
ncbi:MAG: ABC transporter permease subunit [Anaerolineae bacterium]|nr:ABC transporter permease subunit [Anaerolineae bacterium]